MFQQQPFVAVAIVLVFVVASVAGRARLSREENDDNDDDNKKQLLQKMVKAVELGLDFFSQDYSSINVDGLFGMRIGQGQILQALGECKSSSSCPDSLHSRLQTMADGTDTTARAAMKYVEDADPDYYDRFIATIDNPYMIPYRPTTLTDLGNTPAGSDVTYDEETGDSCFARLMGTFVEDGKPVKACNVTRSCWNMMTQTDQAKYSITHQLLYFIIVEKQGCMDVVERSMGAKVAETVERMCGSIYNEAVAEAKEGEVSQMSQDLFMEQVLVCGNLGFENFMRADWMRMVMTWQKPTGCFSLDSPALISMETELAEFKAEERELMKDLKWEVEMIEKQHHGGRKLLREQVMPGGCLSHKSGLGFGTLCLYTRYLVRQNFLDQ